ncbi:MAG: DUF4020 domain-containing protein, partial [Chloroflexota bacterium]|nr:DUF4020 domain-containing protein [Chloroflexota bacterium]
MRIADIEFPLDLWDDLRQGKLVLFAGAGVSMGRPAGLPDFKDLAREIARGTGERRKPKEPEDYFLGRLEDQRGTKVHERAARVLSRSGVKPTDLHIDILRLFKRNYKVRLVTTNFDELFERAIDTEDELDVRPEVFRAPALPLGRDFSGIVHLHGTVSQPQSMVLTDTDFGRAYLTEGWARQFLVDLFRTFPVLFVGYSHNETIMSYLARSLPRSDETKRYALTDSKSAEQMRWQTLGIETIPYPKSRNHRAICKGVKGLACYTRRSILEWKWEIEAIAKNLPPSDKESADIIEESLRTLAKARFFANAATDPAWIDWLDERKHLDAAFGHGDLSDIQGVLSWWLAHHFVFCAADKLFLLIGKHDGRIHPNLWWKIGHEITSSGTEINRELLSKWVSVLASDIPTIDNTDQFILLDLGMQCSQYRLFDRVLQFFDAMTASRLIAEPGFPLDDQEPPIDAEIKMVGEPHVVWGLWRDCLKPNLSEVAKPLLELVVRRLEQRHRSLNPWGQSENWERPAIGSHEQNRSTGPSTVLVDAARDILEWLAETQPEAVASWCKQLAVSDVPLLQRIAIHVVTAQKELNSDEKIDWLLTNLDIHDSRIHYEVFALAGQAYPSLDMSVKKVLVARIREYRWQSKERSELTPKQLEAWNELNWFQWLHEKDPSCPLAKQALDQASNLLPGYKPREHPEFLSYSTVSVGPQSPWTVKELLSKPASEWRDELTSFDPGESFLISRGGLLSTVTEAAKQSFVWGFELAESLMQVNNWETDLWPSLLHAWTAMDINEEQYDCVLSCLDKASVAANCDYEIANVLFSLVQNTGKPYALRFLARANNIASTLWKGLDRDEMENQQKSWLQKAHDHPAGRLTDFWLYGLSVWRNAQEPTPKAMNGEYRAALSAIVQDPTVPGKLGLAVLASKFPFLLSVDRAWTIENLHPSFDSDSDNWEVAREALAELALNPSIAELMELAYLEAVPWSSSRSEYLRGQFILRYTCMIAYFVEDPLYTWIPRLFNYGGEDIGEVFSSSLNENFLWDMDEATQREWWQRWLKDYWVNRLQGVPFALTPTEISKMLRWPAKLTAVFPEAVQLAVQMGTPSSDYGNLLYSL